MDLLDCVLGHLWGHGCQLFGRGQPQDGNLFDQLTAFGFAWKDGPSGQELSQDAPDGPNIDCVRVITASQDQLWCPIVPRYNVWGVQTCGTQYFSAAEITDFNNPLVIHQDVLWLEIPMTDALLVYKLHTEEDLSHKVLYIGHRDQLPSLFCILNDLLEILMAEFEDQVLDDFALFIFRVVDVEELDDVLAASQSIKHLKLS